MSELGKILYIQQYSNGQLLQPIAYWNLAILFENPSIKKHKTEK